MSGWKDWAIGEVVTESEFQSFVQDQVVQVYDDATDRDNTLGANVTEGMMCYLKDVDLTQVFDGSNWVSTVGDITEVVAGDGLSGGGSSGSVTLSVDESALEITKSQVTDFAHASTHESGGSDEIEIAQSQVTGLDTGTEGFTAVSNGSSGLSYQPVSHNYIINGAFDIWQRGTSGFASGVNYTADRWEGSSADKITQSTDTPNDSFEFSLRLNNSTSSTFQRVLTRLEAKDSRVFATQGATLSFWVKANQAAIDNSEVQFYSANTKDNFSSTTFRRSAGFDSLGLTANTWKRVFIDDIASNSAYTNGLELRFWGTIATGAATDFYITGVQLEAGSIATPFKRNANSIAGELAACQRYYQKVAPLATKGSFGNGFNYNTSNAFIMIPLAVPMRTIPETSLDVTGIFELVDVNNSATPVSTLTVNSTERGITMMSIIASVSSGSITSNVWTRLSARNSATAAIGFRAEL